MAVMDRLPPKVLTKLFSHFSPSQLLQLEEVCPQWQRMIQKCAWDGLTSISEATIGYPNEDYLNNFIRLAHRVREVNDFISPFELVNERLHSPQEIRTELRKDYLTNSLRISPKLQVLKSLGDPFDMLTEYFRSSPEMELELKSATLELARKLTTPAGVFPLDAIRHVVVAELKAKESEKITRSVIEETIGQVQVKLRVAEFKSLRINLLFVHSRHGDPFSVELNGQVVPIAIDLSNITQLVIGCLVVRAFWFDWHHDDARECSLAQLRRISSARCLKTIEIETIRIMLYPVWSGDDPAFDLTLELHRDRRQFSSSELECIFQKLTHTDDFVRDTDVALYVKQWTKDKRVECVRVRVDNSMFGWMEHLLLCDRSECIPNSPYARMIAYEFGWQFVDNLHDLHVSYSLKDSNDGKCKFVDNLKTFGMLAPVRVFSAALAHDMVDKLVVMWDTDKALVQMRTLLLSLSDSLDGLDCLTFNFTAGGHVCPCSAFQAIKAANRPLPRLLRFEWIGLPCLPFIVSVVSKSPNLRRLIVGSQPFVHVITGLKWIKRLIDSLGGCKQLVSVQIYSCNDEELIDFPYPKRPAQPRPKDKDIRIHNLFNEIETKLRRLSNKLQSLSHISLLVGKCGYYFVEDKIKKRNGWQSRWLD